MKLFAACSWRRPGHAAGTPHPTGLGQGRLASARPVQQTGQQRTHNQNTKQHQVDQTWLPPSRIASLACVCMMAACPLLSKFSIPKFQHPHIRAAYTHTGPSLRRAQTSNLRKVLRSGLPVTNLQYGKTAKPRKRGVLVPTA